MRIEPRAATSATAEPEISAKNIEAEMLTMARPPRMKPKTAEAKSTSRCEIPDAFMIAPARMKRGMAIRGKPVAPENMTRPTFGNMPNPPVTTIATTAMSPSATAMGTLTRMRTRRSRIRAMVTGPLRPRCEHPHP